MLIVFINKEIDINKSKSFSSSYSFNSNRNKLSERFAKKKVQEEEYYEKKYTPALEATIGIATTPTSTTPTSIKEESNNKQNPASPVKNKQ